MENEFSKSGIVAWPNTEQPSSLVNHTSFEEDFNLEDLP